MLLLEVTQAITKEFPEADSTHISGFPKTLETSVGNLQKIVSTNRFQKSFLWVLIAF
jgi:hypothetical protein